MIAKQVHHPLAPVYDKDCRVLFLGTMPSPQSRADGFYYAHPRNRFWPVLAGILLWVLLMMMQTVKMRSAKSHLVLSSKIFKKRTAR